MKPIYFKSPSDFGRWLAKHHDTVAELLVGFRKRHTGKPSMTWSESVDEALCWGWIDGIRRSVDAENYTIRFTPRRLGSIWSATNVRKVKELIRQGRMQSPGLAAFKARRPDRTGVYSFEQRSHGLSADFEQQFISNGRAWKYFQSQPPWYRRSAAHWVMSAKREETRSRRLATLIDDSAAGRTVAPLTRTQIPK